MSTALIYAGCPAIISRSFLLKLRVEMKNQTVAAAIKQIAMSTSVTHSFDSNALLHHRKKEHFLQFRYILTCDYERHVIAKIWNQSKSSTECSRSARNFIEDVDQSIHSSQSVRRRSALFNSSKHVTHFCTSPPTISRGMTRRINSTIP